MRTLVHFVLFFVISLSVGFGLSYWALEKGQLFGTLHIGPWIAWSDVGSPQPDPYTRAYISRNANLELSRAEGIKFVAKQDSDGRNILAECTYRIDGTTPETSLWTLMAVNAQGASLTLEGGPMTLRSDQINRADDGSFALRVGPSLSPSNWLETSANGQMILILTLYDSSVFSGLSSLSNSLPSIFVERC
ncbi:MAG: DUF1214 domain-containing protein [Devosiaceae bacterium]|nr:DUF1214 domain-containing protein [Devosiaceae bacterium]